MSLQTDAIFIRAISASSDIMETIGDRLYGTAIPMPEEDADNVPVPYIIVTFDGMANVTATKDSSMMEGDEDNVTIGVEIVAETLEDLHTLVADVRTQIREFVSDPEANEDNDIEDFPTDYTLTASAIQYDSTKPCYWQDLTYQCVTDNIQ